MTPLPPPAQPAREPRHSRLSSRSPRPAPLQVSHILLSPDKKGLLPQLRQQIQAGEASLAALAAEHSQCPSRR